MVKYLTIIDLFISPFSFEVCFCSLKLHYVQIYLNYHFFMNGLIYHYEISLFKSHYTINF